MCLHPFGYASASAPSLHSIVGCNLHMQWHADRKHGKAHSHPTAHTVPQRGLPKATAFVTPALLPVHKLALRRTQEWSHTLAPCGFPPVDPIQPGALRVPPLPAALELTPCRSRLHSQPRDPEVVSTSSSTTTLTQAWVHQRRRPSSTWRCQVVPHPHPAQAERPCQCSTTAGHLPCLHGLHGTPLA